MLGEEMLDFKNQMLIHLHLTNDRFFIRQMIGFLEHMLEKSEANGQKTPDHVINLLETEILKALKSKERQFLVWLVHFRNFSKFPK